MSLYLNEFWKFTGLAQSCDNIDDACTLKACV